MANFDVAIVGGGPAGSTCAWRLQQAGLNVAVVDRAAFPRDKVCAGWITPQVIDDLQLDVDDYRIARRLQTFTGFRVGLIGGERDIETRYERPVSFGIRRCEFDHYLLQRSGATLRLGAPVSSIRRDGAIWRIDDSVRAPMLIGAGGHFCPVARLLNGTRRTPRLVAAQEAEFPIEASDAHALHVASEAPELFFSRDLKGYGWCVRKCDYLNIGFGHLSDRALPEASAEFASFLKQRHRIPPHLSWRWKGHAYLLADPPQRTTIDDGVMLVGDAAGLAYAQSGEGIRPAIESGILAASAVISAAGQYSRTRLAAYDGQLRDRFGSSALARAVSHVMPERASLSLGPWLLQQPWFVRRVVLDRWFLHRSEVTQNLQAPPLRTAHAS
jgi:flavin-dependent dehydrogenase